MNESTPSETSTPGEGTRQDRCIVTRLRQTRADMIGTDDEQHYFDCHEAAGEIERLRLTDAEREALEIAIEYVGSAYAVEHHAQTIARLLERLG